MYYITTSTGTDLLPVIGNLFSWQSLDLSASHVWGLLLMSRVNVCAGGKSVRVCAGGKSVRVCAGGKSVRVCAEGKSVRGCAGGCV